MKLLLSFIKKKAMSFVDLLFGAAALYVTDIMISPMIAGTEFGMWIKFIAQAWVLSKVYTGYLSNMISQS